MIELESKNFRVDSENWSQFVNAQGITYLESPTKDIWEYVAGPIIWRLVNQQLFSWVAAMRETEKMGERMPTAEEWKQMLMKREVLAYGAYPGYCSGYSGGRVTFFRIGFVYWQSTSKNICVQRSCDTFPAMAPSLDLDVGQSVRCLKN